MRKALIKLFEPRYSGVEFSVVLLISFYYWTNKLTLIQASVLLFTLAFLCGIINAHLEKRKCIKN